MTIPVYSTTLLPDIIGQSWVPQRVFDTLLSDPKTGSDQAALLTPSPNFWAFDLGYEVLSIDQAAQWLAAWQMCGGNYGGMFWFEWISKAATNVFVGTGAGGVATTFTLPVKGAASGTTTIRVNGTPTGVTFEIGTGPNGEDRIVFGAAPANGATIRADFTGRRRRFVRVRNLKIGARKGGASLLFVGTMQLIEKTAGDA
jgi:hypothetical protein